MDLLLTDTEIRVLGCLLEKKMATPEYYPLSLNALTIACNQKSNRDPVVAYGEETVTEAIAGLKEKRLAWESGAGRVPKFEESFMKSFNLVNREAAVLCILMLRGPQTIGEVRGRTERMHGFENLEAVQETLKAMEEMALVKILPRLPGRKEPRYMHLLAGEPEVGTEPLPEIGQASEPRTPVSVRLAELEQDVALLRRELDALKEDFLNFKGQF